jgi:hypothetical protein
MKRTAHILLIGLVFVAASTVMRAQDQPTQAPEVPSNPLKIGLVVSEFDGKQKVSSLPYEFVVSFRDSVTSRNATGRFGARIPIAIESKDEKFTYLDLGTNYDCSAHLQKDGRYEISISLERSALAEADGSLSKPQTNTFPRVRQFKTYFAVVLRDGESVLASSGTDPLTGHTWQVDVNLKVLK